MDKPVNNFVPDPLFDTKPEIGPEIIIMSALEESLENLVNRRINDKKNLPKVIEAKFTISVSKKIVIR